MCVCNIMPELTTCSQSQRGVQSMVSAACWLNAPLIGRNGTWRRPFSRAACKLQLASFMVVVTGFTVSLFCMRMRRWITFAPKSARARSKFPHFITTKLQCTALTNNTLCTLRLFGSLLPCTCHEWWCVHCTGDHNHKNKTSNSMINIVYIGLQNRTNA